MPPGDFWGMGGGDMPCDGCREAISAGLDGEQLLDEAAAVATHVEGCRECRSFAERAARITRLTRTRLAEPTPDLATAVAAAAPRPRRRIGVDAVRVALGGVGIAQLALAVSGMVGGEAGAHHGAVELAGASAAHLANESAAWNVALAVGFLWARRAAHDSPACCRCWPRSSGCWLRSACSTRSRAGSTPVGCSRTGWSCSGWCCCGCCGGSATVVVGSGGWARRAVDRSAPGLRRRPDDGDGLRPSARHRAA